MKEKVLVSAVDIKSGEYNGKHFDTIFVSYFNDFGGNRNKAICKEDVINFCKDYAKIGHKYENNQGFIIHNFYFDPAIDVIIDTVEDKYHEKQYIITHFKVANNTGE